MVATNEHRGDLAPLEVLRPGVLRVLEQPLLETFVGMAVLSAKHAGDETHDGLEQRHGGDLAAGKHVVADRDLLETARLDDALVDALEPSADDDGAGSGRKRAY